MASCRGEWEEARLGREGGEWGGVVGAGAWEAEWRCPWRLDCELSFSSAEGRARPAGDGEERVACLCLPYCSPSDLESEIPSTLGTNS